MRKKTEYTHIQFREDQITYNCLWSMYKGMYHEWVTLWPDAGQLPTGITIGCPSVYYKEADQLEKRATITILFEVVATGVVTKCKFYPKSRIFEIPNSAIEDATKGTAS